MTKKTIKLQLSVLFGGQSPEHPISIASAINVASRLDQKKYDITLIYIDHAGAWYRLPSLSSFSNADPKSFSETHAGERITVLSGERAWLSLEDGHQRYPVDCVFPVLHGGNGEDGAIQGLLDLLGLPYVGCSVLSSATCMSKDVTKHILRSAGVPVVDWQEILSDTPRVGLYADLKMRFGASLIVKPVRAGSSVGINKVSDEVAFFKALDDAFRYDQRLIVEPCVVGREIECAVLGNDAPQASIPGEIIAPDAFYSYFEKYDAKSSTHIVVPADLPEPVVERIKAIAIEAFQALQCSGMARVDFFILKTGELVINELNTIPGFTDISMYPKMWEASGLSYAALLDRLIDLGLERHASEQRLVQVYHRDGQVV